METEVGGIDAVGAVGDGGEHRGVQPEHRERGEPVGHRHEHRGAAREHERGRLRAAGAPLTGAAQAG